MKKLVIASKNKGKLKEFKEILSGLPYEVISMADVGFNDDIEETGSTFEENALLKARALAKATGEIVLADDSGLMVDILDGAPGIYSARFAGSGSSDADNNSKLLSLLKNVDIKDRTARFVCVIAFVFPDGKSSTLKGEWEGVIGFEPKGSNGFGYDPLFYLPEFNLTAAELDSETKNSISHRSKALTQLVNMLTERE